MSDPPQRQVVTTDRDLRQFLVRHRNGDRYAFSELISHFRSPVYSYLTRAGLNTATCDDLFQEIFLKVHKSAHRYRSEQALEPWLFTIVANTVRSALRKERMEELINSNHKKALRPESINGEDIAQAGETALWLEAALKKLPFSQREAIVLSCVKDLSQQNIAQILDTPVCTGKDQLASSQNDIG